MKPKRKFTSAERSVIVELYRLGKIDKEVAVMFGIPRSTFIGMLEYNGLTDTTKNAKEEANEIVEKSLFKRANGFEWEETKTETEIDKNGQPHITRITKTTKLIYPDTGAIAFFLKNRKPLIWRDRRDVSVSAEPEAEIALKDFKKLLKNRKDRQKQKKIKKKGGKK